MSNRVQHHGLVESSATARTARCAAVALSLFVAAAISISIDGVPSAQADAGGAATGGARLAATAIDAAHSHSCVIVTGGHVTCWGSDDNGRLGNGAITGDRPVADAVVAMPDGRRATEVVTGQRHTCTLLDDGRVTCWGSGEFGKTGNGTPSGDLDRPPAPIDMTDGATVTALAAGNDHTCALLVDGRVVCWGDDINGQLGNGASPATSTPGDAVLLPGGARAVAITTGEAHTCALLDTGEVSCWGWDAAGQLGDGTPIANQQSPSAPLDLPEPAIGVSGGRDHTCAVLESGTVSCWGANNLGQLGDGTGGPGEPGTVTPGTPLTFPAPVVAVAAGQAHTCAVMADGAVSCWGWDNGGQVGDGGAMSNTVVDVPSDPIDLPAGRTATAVAAGTGHTCATLDTGDVSCWGFDGNGQLGNGDASTGPQVRPGPPNALPRVFEPAVTQITTGDSYTCALLDTGDVVCWGLDQYESLGNGSGRVDAVAPSDPIALPGDTKAVAIEAGDFHACALLDTDDVTCWGLDNREQLGDGVGLTNVGAPPDPIALPGEAGAVAIAGFHRHTCALLDDGQVTCWGADFSEQLGNGPGDDNVATPPEPITLPGNSSAAAIAGGEGHTCALLEAGEITCWGSDGSGQLGNGPGLDGADRPPVPIELPGDAAATAIESGRFHVCALLETGEITCWGSDNAGQLGNGPGSGDIASPPPPIALPDDVAATAIAAAEDHTCALLETDTVTCWGYDAGGQLGNGTSSLDVETPPQPITLPGDVPATSIAAGQSHVCALMVNGQVSCWGDNRDGQVGNGELADSVPRPVPVGSVSKVEPQRPGVSTSDSVVAIDPARYLDTRPGESTFDGRHEGGGVVNGGSVLTVQVAGRGDIAADATAVVGNLTAVSPIGPGFATLYPCTPQPPLAANLNYRAGTNVGNTTTVALSDDGELCIFTRTTAHFTLDITGYVPTGSVVTASSPARYLDTRPGEATFDGQHQGAGPVTGATFIEVPIAGRGTVPADATTALVNLTVVDPIGPGFATLYPCGTRPLASSVNYTTGVNTPNGALAALSPTGTVCIFTRTAAHVVLDVTGHAVANTQLETRTPARFLDTRSGEDTIDGRFAGLGSIPADSSIEIEIIGRPGVPDDAAAITANLTAVDPTGAGFVTAYPCGQRPLTSTLNFAAGTNRGNNTLVRLSPDGTICLYARTATDLVLDVTGATR